jgi:predicted RNA-binding protein
MSEIKKEVADEIMKEDNDFLMDPYDRQILLNKILDRAREINGTILYINLVLKNAKKTPYIYQVPWLNNYVNLDKVIINDIIQKYQVLKY